MSCQYDSVDSVSQSPVTYYLLRGIGLTETEHSDRAFLALAAGGVVAGLLLFAGQ